MRVLLVNDLAPGDGWGAERHVGQLHDALTAAGVDVELFAGEVVHNGWRNALDMWDPWARRELLRRAARFQPDVIHHHNVLRELSPSVLGVPRGTASVLTVHDFRLLGVADPGTKRGPRARLRSWVDDFGRSVARTHIDVAIGVSDVVADGLRAAGFPDVAYVPCHIPAPPDALSVVPVAAAHDIVFAGRLTIDKGPAVLVDAFNQIAARHPQSRLLLAGEGPERATIEAKIANTRAGPARVVLLGRLSSVEVLHVIAASRVVAVPSLPCYRREGGSLTAVEGASLGRPIVAGDDPAVREVVEELGGGLVVAAGDVAALAAALDRLLTDDALATSLGDTGRQGVAGTRTADVVVPQVLEVYDRAIARATDRRSQPGR